MLRGRVPGWETIGRKTTLIFAVKIDVVSRPIAFRPGIRLPKNGYHFIKKRANTYSVFQQIVFDSLFQQIAFVACVSQ